MITQTTITCLIWVFFAFQVVFMTYEIKNQTQARPSRLCFLAVMALFGWSVLSHPPAPKVDKLNPAEYTLSRSYQDEVTVNGILFPGKETFIVEKK